MILIHDIKHTWDGQIWFEESLANFRSKVFKLPRLGGEADDATVVAHDRQKRLAHLYRAKTAQN